jgi:hypothetical protein
VIFVFTYKTILMRRHILPVLFIIFLGSIVSCFKIEKVPPVPLIKFKDFQIFDSTDILGNQIKGGRLNFTFQDGDGDLGLPVSGSGIRQDSSNLFFILFRKTNGIFTKAPDNDILAPSSYRIPYMNRQGQNQVLKGNINVTFLYLFATPADTIKYEFYVTDRAQHFSNTVSTCEIVFTKNSICYE